jgi:hypothetical protein
MRRFFTRPLLVIMSISLLGSFGLWLLGISQLPGGTSSYAILTFSDAIPDREIRQRLEEAGITNEVSESGQWFFLDTLGGVERIPLDELGTRLLSFDPRNDGYAEKVRSLFVHDGIRTMYFPLPSAMAGAYEAKIASALGDIPFSFEHSGSQAGMQNDKANAPVPSANNRLPFLLLGIFALASCAFFLIRPLRSALRPVARCLLPCLPTFAPLSLWGASGFVLAALLCGIAVLFAERSKLSGQSSARWLLLSVLFAFYGAVVFLAGISVLFALLAIVFFSCILALSHWSISSNGEIILPIRPTSKGFFFNRSLPGQHHFSPVPIIKRRIFNIGFSMALVPFTVVALVLAITGFGTPTAVVTDASFLPPSGTVTEEEYLEHFLFQSTFSIRRLPASGIPTHNSPAGMSVYRLASDGLPELVSHEGGLEVQTAAQEMIDQGLVPAFPLGDFYRGLEEAGKQASKGKASRGMALPEIFFALVPLLFIIPCLIIRPNSGILMHNSHESVFVPSRRAFIRRPDRPTERRF